jgi:hypothetical protein
MDAPLEHYRTCARTLRHAVTDLRDALRGIAAAAEEWDPAGEQSDRQAEDLIAAASDDLAALVRESPSFRQLLAGFRRVDAPAVGQVGEEPA